MKDKDKRYLHESEEKFIEQEEKVEGEVEKPEEVVPENNNSTAIPTLIIFKSLMSRMYAHNEKDFSYENLEFLGDTVLKLLTSMEMYCDHPNYDEGCLHISR